MFMTLSVTTNAWGADVTFTTTSSGGFSSNSKTTNGVTVKFNGSPSWQSGHVRVYAGATIDFSSTSNNITKIVMTATSSDYAKTWSAGSGNITVSNSTITWTGSAKSITLKNTATAQSRLSKIVVSIADSHTVTWTINPAAGGSLSPTSGTSTTVTPNVAYTYDSPAYTVTPAGKANVSQDGDNFTATPSANCTIQINMVEKTPANISFENMGNPTPITTGYYVGDTYTLPTKNDYICGDKTFVGWSTKIIENSPTKPTAATYFEPGASVTLAADQTFYAVFAEASGDGEEGWKKVTSTDQVKDGEIYAFISFDDAYYLANALSTSDPIVKAVSKTNGILNVTNEMKWIANANSGGFEFKSYSNNDYYLWGGSANDAIRINTTSAKANATKVWYTKILNTYGVVIYHNASTDGVKYLATNGSSNWRNYLDNNTLGNTNRVANLYKFTSGATYSDYTTSCVPTYTITWKNEDGTVLATDKIAENTRPEYNGSTPIKAADAQYTYTFDGWTPDIVEATENATYTATYTATVNKYTITWKNEDETLLETDENVPYGETPSYNGATPAKAATAQYTYTFNGWSPEVKSVTGNATYTATFTETINQYQVTFNMNDHGDEITAQTVDYGSTAAEPSPAPTADGYEFAGWYKDEQCTIPWNFDTDVITGNTAIHAKWLQIFTITWKANGLVYKTTSVTEGDPITPPSSPDLGDFCGQVFVGWTTAEMVETTNVAPILYPTPTPFPTATNETPTTFYAVFADYEN